MRSPKDRNRPDKPPLEGGGRAVRVYLARHGQTALNAAGAVRGHIDVPLDIVGRRQAEALGAELAQERPVAIISSPLLRAQQTALPLAERAGLPIRTDQRFADRFYGEWAGVSVKEVIERWGSLDLAPGVEAVAEVRERALAALADAALEAKGGPVVVVSHDAVNRIALCGLEPRLGSHESVPQETGCFNVLECRWLGTGPLEWYVVLVNQGPSGLPTTQVQ
ncbi:MAG TPA: histidine phosphatase family protein [Acidimicrobiales bacterium]|nr:histidine phosphatase family protein [Acidimicrobiales bacterium]